MARLLLLSVFVIATCGLIYELVAGALASYSGMVGPRDEGWYLTS